MSKCSIIVVHNSFILVYYDAGNMDMTSIKWKVFLPYKKRGWLQHTMDYKVCGLARLTLYENLFIEEEKTSIIHFNRSVCIKWVEYREN